MARMWMVRGEGGSLYDVFRERGVAAVGWNQLAAHAKPGIGRKQLGEDAAIELVLKQAESLSNAQSK